MADLSRPFVSELTGSCVGVAGALAAASAAARARQADLDWQRRQDRIEARQRTVIAKRARNAALQRELAATRALADMIAAQNAAGGR